MVSRPNLWVQLSLARGGVKAGAQQGVGGDATTSACPAYGGLQVCSKGHRVGKGLRELSSREPPRNETPCCSVSQMSWVAENVSVCDSSSVTANP